MNLKVRITPMETTKVGLVQLLIYELVILHLLIY